MFWIYTASSPKTVNLLFNRKWLPLRCHENATQSGESYSGSFMQSPSGYLRLQFTTEYQVNDFEQSWPPSWYLEQEPGFLKACVVINFFALSVNVCHTSNFWRSVPHRINMAMFEIFISFALNHFPQNSRHFHIPTAFNLPLIGFNHIPITWPT